MCGCVQSAEVSILGAFLRCQFARLVDVQLPFSLSMLSTALMFEQCNILPFCHLMTFEQGKLPSGGSHLEFPPFRPARAEQSLLKQPLLNPNQILEKR